MGSEMCIRDSPPTPPPTPEVEAWLDFDSSLGDVAFVPAPSEAVNSTLTSLDVAPPPLQDVAPAPPQDVAPPTPRRIEGFDDSDGDCNDEAAEVSKGDDLFNDNHEYTNNLIEDFQAREDTSADPRPPSEHIIARQSIPGADYSVSTFNAMYDSLASFEAKINNTKELPSEELYTITGQVQQLTKLVKTKEPRWGDRKVRLAVAALSVFRMRLIDMSLRDNVLMKARSGNTSPHRATGLTSWAAFNRTLLSTFVISFCSWKEISDPS